jgi:hypothetical protein
MRLLKSVPFLVMLCFFTAVNATADPTGVTGRTLKTVKTGCSCHGTSANPGVLVTIAGPDTVMCGHSAAYTLTISGGPAVKAGCDIATRFGTLAAVSSTLRLSNKELTQRSALTISGGKVTLQFNYTAPMTGNVDTLFATGNSVNGNGSESGDSWNWAPSKLLTLVTATTEVENTAVAVAPFSLEVNSPNPFGSTTEFHFSIGTNAFTTLKVYNLRGEEVAVVVSDVLAQGAYSYRWKAGALPEGVYLYRLQAGLYTQTRKLIVAR